MFIDFTGLICFDLETAGSHRSLSELGQENPRMVDLWEKLYEKRRTANDQRFLECSSPEEAYVNNAGLYPEFGRIVNASFAMYNEEMNTIQVISVAGNDEREIINSCNTMFSKSAWIAGHNVKGFDVPFFSRRAFINRVMPHDNIDTVTKKPWDVRILDTQEIWKFGSFNHSFTSLDLLTTSMGLESPKTEHFGAHVSHMFWDEWNLEEIAKYCEGDVISTMKLLIMFNDVDSDVSSIDVERKPMKLALFSEDEPSQIGIGND
jgi:hypothetical protein